MIKHSIKKVCTVVFEAVTYKYFYAYTTNRGSEKSYEYKLQCIFWCLVTAAAADLHIFPQCNNTTQTSKKKNSKTKEMLSFTKKMCK